MRVIVVGGMGTIGSAVVKMLSERHEVVVAGRKAGAVTVDLAAPDSIRAMFQTVGKFDAVVSAAGQAKFGIEARPPTGSRAPTRPAPSGLCG